MPVPEYPECVSRLRAVEPDLAEELAPFHGVGDVLAWMQQRGLTRTEVDLIGQDEFHYDFLVRLAPQGRWVVFGVT